MDAFIGFASDIDKIIQDFGVKISNLPYILILIKC